MCMFPFCPNEYKVQKRTQPLAMFDISVLNCNSSAVCLSWFLSLCKLSIQFFKNKYLIFYYFSDQISTKFVRAFPWSPSVSKILNLIVRVSHAMFCISVSKGQEGSTCSVSWLLFSNKSISRASISRPQAMRALSGSANLKLPTRDPMFFLFR